MSATVIGFDPGANVGHALLRIGGDMVRGRVATHLESGFFRAETATLDWIRCLVVSADLVALENATWVHTAKGAGDRQALARASALIDAAKTAERIATIAETLGKRVVRMTAGKARTLIVGRNNASDATLKVACQRLVRGLPARTNAHERDAMIVAMAVGFLAVWPRPVDATRRTGT